MGESLPRDTDYVCKGREVEFIRWVWETVGRARLELSSWRWQGCVMGKAERARSRRA